MVLEHPRCSSDTRRMANLVDTSLDNTAGMQAIWAFVIGQCMAFFLEFSLGMHACLVQIQGA